MRSSKMELHVQTSSSKVIDVIVNCLDTIYDLKKIMYQQEGIRIEDQQYFLIDEKTNAQIYLQNDFIIADCNIIRQEDGSNLRLFFVTEERITIRLDRNNSYNMLIGEFKKFVQDKIGIPSDVQRLIFGNQQLEDTLTLQDYHILKENIIDLTLCMRGC